MCIYVYIHIGAIECVCVYEYICMYVCMYTYIYIYIYAYEKIGVWNFEGISERQFYKIKEDHMEIARIQGLCRGILFVRSGD